MVVKAPNKISEDDIARIQNEIPKQYGKKRATTLKLIDHRRNMIPLVTLERTDDILYSGCTVAVAQVNNNIL